jgi:hypothetical protein
MTLSLLAIVMALAQVITAEPVDGVLARDRELPPRASAWAGDAPHRFLDGRVTLFCGSHGTFSGGAVAPGEPGQTAEIEYAALFTGELVLNPPVVPVTERYPISDPIRMTERVTARSVRGGRSTYATELTKVSFDGSDFPAYVSVRESPVRRSAGFATITRDRQGQFRISSSYEVWLEISVDGRRSWHPASEAVTMKLVPGPHTATVSAVSADD